MCLCLCLRLSVCVVCFGVSLVVVFLVCVCVCVRLLVRVCVLWCLLKACSMHVCAVDGCSLRTVCPVLVVSCFLLSFHHTLNAQHNYHQYDRGDTNTRQIANPVGTTIVRRFACMLADYFLCVPFYKRPCRSYTHTHIIS